MTRKEQREVARALAFAHIPVEDTSLRERIREEIALSVGERLGFGGDAFEAQVSGIRMTEDGE